MTRRVSRRADGLPAGAAAGRAGAAAGSAAAAETPADDDEDGGGGATGAFSAMVAGQYPNAWSAATIARRGDTAWSASWLERRPAARREDCRGCVRTAGFRSLRS